ncbi:MAG: hypothetical protein R3E68_06605 [Burkholderiaceae bacterium]
MDLHRAGGHQVLRRSILGVCGIDTTRTCSIGPVNRASADQRNRWISGALRLGMTLGNRPSSRFDRLRKRAAAYPGDAAAVLSDELDGLHHRGLARQSAAHAVVVESVLIGYALLFSVKVATVFSNVSWRTWTVIGSIRTPDPSTGDHWVLVDGSLNAVSSNFATVAMLTPSAVSGLAALLSVSSGSASW